MEIDLAQQERLVRGLLEPAAYPHAAAKVEHLETHISHVLLAGDYAYKIKKPLDLGFLDFSTLDRRRHFCAEELRINRRLAPTLYLGVTAITGTLECPQLDGEGEVLDYAVRMRRFPQDALLRGQPLDAALVERIAEEIARFHSRIPAVDPGEPYGTPAAVVSPMRENIAQIRERLDDPKELARLDRIEAWIESRFEALRPRLRQRRAEGRVRECHGDMHLGNIARVAEELVIFDGIEFNPALRWIDTMSELAFLIMDLEHGGQRELARLCLARYLEISGDYPGMCLLPFYKVYRAMVRAKVISIRLSQPDLSETERSEALAEYRVYAALAEGYGVEPQPAIIITHGVSGAGKSSLAQMLALELPALRIRSDVERKRLFELEAPAGDRSGLGQGLYSPEVTADTYRRLLKLADNISDACQAVVVDATFLERAQRRRFRDLARARGLPFLILSVEAPEELLRERVARRLAGGRDASEATLAVLEGQLVRREPLDPEEEALTLHVDSSQEWDETGLLAAVRERLRDG
jgi:aminoglycoside phosphotransferase family enzyme/predicted kinase